MKRAIFIFSAAILFFLTIDLNQKNEETIFLNKKDRKNFETLNEKLPINYSLLINPEKNIQKEVKKLCDDSCDIISKSNLPNSFNDLFNLKNNQLIILSSNQELIKNVSRHMHKNDITQFGGPYINVLLDEYSKIIKNVLFPLVFVALFILTLLITRRPILTLDLYLPVLCSALISQALIKLFYENSNLITGITPLLMAVLNFSLTLHYYFTSLQTKCFKQTLLLKKKAFIMMASTTFIGLLSLISSPIEVIGQFGLLSSTSLIITYTITIFWLKSLRYEISDNSFKPNKKIQHFIDPLKNKSSTLVLTLIAGSIGFYMSLKLPVITDATKYFLDRPNLRKDFISSSKKIVGMPTLDIIIKLKKNGNITELSHIQKIEKEIREGTSKFDAKVISPNEVVKRVNLTYSGINEIPTSLISYQALFSRFSENTPDSLLSSDLYKITVLSEPFEIDRYEKMLGEIKKILNKQAHHFSFSGIHYFLTMAQKEIIFTLIKSFFLSLIVISLLSALWLRSFKIFCLFIYINTAPVLISFIFLFLLNGSLNIATVMTYSISLGLIVDSSFHLINDLGQGHSMDRIFKQTKTPIILSSIMLIFLFSLFHFVPFLPIQEFGLNLSILLTLGLIFDLKILPTFLKKTPS